MIAWIIAGIGWLVAGAVWFWRDEKTMGVLEDAIGYIEHEESERERLLDQLDHWKHRAELAEMEAAEAIEQLRKGNK